MNQSQPLIERRHYGKCNLKKPVVDHPHRNTYRFSNSGKEVVEIEIKRGKYILRSDNACCWVDEEYEVTNKKTGKTSIRTKCISGYYPNFRMLAETGLPSHLVRSSDAKSMKKLVEDVKKLEEKIGKMAVKQMETLTDDLSKPIP